MRKTVLAVVVAAFAGASGDLKDLSFLEGEWKGESGGTVIEERWTDGAGGTMLGLSRTLSSGSIVAFEFLRIEARADGVFYVAQPGGRPPTEFKLTRASAGEAIFENPQHDHPKIIRYRREGDGLSAELEGDEGKQVFRFRRKAAP